MKKSILIIVISGIVLASLVIWIGQSENVPDWREFVQYGIILVLVVFALGMAIKRIRSHREGLPAEDEYSRKALKLAASRSYFFSLYLWLFIMYLNYSGKYESSVLMGAGILGMAVLLALHWIYIKFTGIKNE